MTCGLSPKLQTNSGKRKNSRLLFSCQTPVPRDPDKCNLISITQKRKPIHFTYKLHDHPLAKVEHSKYLGITLQSNLKWNKHINSITNKANQSLGFLKRNLKIKSSAVKSHAYKAFVRPKLEYASAVWDPHTRTQINQIEKVQRRAARYVTNRYHNTSSVTDNATKFKLAILRNQENTSQTHNVL